MLRPTTFPVQGGGRYTNDWGNPRSGGRQHKGTDIFAPMGTPVVAVMDGKITAAGDDGGKGGLRIWLSGKFYYAHLSKLAPGIKAGTPVKAGQVIGFVGDSGNAKGGEPHLHFGYDPKGGQSAGGSWENPFPILQRWETGRGALAEPVAVSEAASTAPVPQAVQPADLEFGDGPPVGPPMPALPGAEDPGSSVIPFREPGTAGELWRLVSPQSQDGRRLLEIATAGDTNAA